MTDSHPDPLEKLLLYAMTDAFNRSLNALEAAGALNLKNLRSEYTGVGSRYYDIVTDAMMQTVAQHRPVFERLIGTQQ